MKHKTNCLPLTCQRISTDVVVCGVTERIVGASSGAGAIKGRRNGLNWAENVHNSRRLIWACAVAFTEHKHTAGCNTTEPLTDESKTAALTQHSSFSLVKQPQDERLPGIWRRPSRLMVTADGAHMTSPAASASSAGSATTGRFMQTSQAFHRATDVSEVINNQTWKISTESGQM